MIPATLLSILFFAGHAYSSEEYAAKYEAFLKGEIEKNFQIDGSNPPYIDSASTGSRRCAAAGSKYNCGEVQFFPRYDVLRGTPRAYKVLSVDGRAVNTSPDNNSTVTMQMSTAIMESRTTGWVFGGKISGELDKLPVIGKVPSIKGVEFSATYSTLKTEAKTETKVFGQTFPCPTLSECRVETWTWHVEIEGGTCKYPYPMFDCGKKANVCEAKDSIGRPDLPCHDNMEEYRREHCGFLLKAGKYKINEGKEVQCPSNGKTPIHEDDGKPFTVIVPLYRPYSQNKRSELDPQSSKWKIIY